MPGLLLLVIIFPVHGPYFSGFVCLGDVFVHNESSKQVWSNLVLQRIASRGRDNDVSRDGSCLFTLKCLRPIMQTT